MAILFSWYIVGLVSASHQGLAHGVPPGRGRWESRECTMAAEKQGMEWAWLVVTGEKGLGECARHGHEECVELCLANEFEQAVSSIMVSPNLPFPLPYFGFTGFIGEFAPGGGPPSPPRATSLFALSSRALAKHS